MNALLEAQQLGQSIWLDFIERRLLDSGDLQRLVDEDGLGGVTSNPAIFEKAIGGAAEYATAIGALAHAGVSEPKAIYEALAIDDIRRAADVLLPVFRRTEGRDGFVSLEVSPDLAHDVAGTVAEGRRLWQAVGRENVLIKVPATDAGATAIQQLISDGISVNVTLLFSIDAYTRVADAYSTGLETYARGGGDLRRVASVASFFVSRIDTVVDRALAERAANVTDPTERAHLVGLMGQAAIANAKLAYQVYLRRLREPRWRALAERGARSQRLLWASTGAKNPAYRDTIYVEELIGLDTVNTVPPTTYEAFRAHGRPRASLTEQPERAAEIMRDIGAAGISMASVADDLLTDGLRQFSDAFRTLLAAVAQRLAALPVAAATSPTYRIPAALGADVEAALDDWTRGRHTERLWSRDASLWTGGDEAKWLDWLTVIGRQQDCVGELHAIAADIQAARFSHVLLLGMGGSSLCPDVLRRAFGRVDGFPELHVLDSTDPTQIADAAAQVNLAETLVIVSSKSGGTLEPNILFEYFHERIAEVVGAEHAGERFVAITDPGSSLEQLARRHGFRHIVHGEAGIGGRYSALSAFGTVPAAVMGLDVDDLLERAARMAAECAASVPPRDNPGVRLGLTLGTLATHGRNTLTVIASPPLRSFGGWLEQLVAESTGKHGRGIVPVDGEAVAHPALYGADRVFVYVRLETGADARQDAAVRALEDAGHAVIRIPVAELMDLGREFFRWEIATAVAGAVMGINPFDQPDVEAAKIATRAITDAYETSGALPAETVLVQDRDLTFYAHGTGASALAWAVTAPAPAAACFRAHLGRLAPGDYLALLAYLPMRAETADALQAIRHILRDHFRVATCLEFGPRFLHSTGQLYKGGPNTGVFLQITCDDAADLAVPGRRFSFGTVKAAQAQGDMQVLVDRGRRILHVHLSGDLPHALQSLRRAIVSALGDAWE